MLESTREVVVFPFRAAHDHNAVAQLVSRALARRTADRGTDVAGDDRPTAALQSAAERTGQPPARRAALRRASTPSDQRQEAWIRSIRYRCRPDGVSTSTMSPTV